MHRVEWVLGSPKKPATNLFATIDFNSLHIIIIMGYCGVSKPIRIQSCALSHLDKIFIAGIFMCACENVMAAT